ncbi:hypothetical protein N7495_005195 [Penicillium taxi]|uniref:uncharacterized protein n=1 Tax=Penicillium taxi TaxID=168475 RepID=UPI0025455508|nr:uncharacterized protein N7495_005195 [Penicillium taxi]KAJ5893504.1 hypothetical protein N7495_005195 [Penicillium taxi]
MSDTSASPRRLNARSVQNAHIAHLQYPTLPPLTASVEEWLSRSRPADNMTSDNITDSQPKSLSDSWAELSVSDFHSEDGSRSEPTDAGSIIDQATPDDVASLDGRSTSSEVDGIEVEEDQGQDGENQENNESEDDESESEQDDGHDNDQDDNQSLAESHRFALHYHKTPSGSGIEDSNLTTRTAFRQSVDSIEFVEPDKWPEMERVELKHTIRIFQDAELADMKVPQSFDSAHSILTATVQQTMAKTGMELDKPFRVLYIGRPEFRNIILDKIGDVLVSNSSAGSPTSSAESSRYHVVPTSFGAGAVPNFAELLPIHVQLVVDECVVATAKSTDQHSPVSLTFKNRPSCRSWWDGENYRVSSVTDWTLPDMAIIFVSNNDDVAAIQTQRLTHNFLDRHGIPAMVISEEPLWNNKPRNIPLNHNSLHMCLESRHHQTGEISVLQRYPIDLKTFESIAPDQLNRNLASLMGLYPKKAVKITTDSPKSLDSWTFADLEKYSRSWILPYVSCAPKWGNLLSLLTLTLISAIALSIGYTAFNYVAIFLSQFLAESALSRAISPTTTPIFSTSALNVDYERQSSLILRPSGHLQDLKDLSSDCLNDRFAGLDLELSKTPDSFEIKTLGDCHVIIRTPRNLASSRKQPPFNVSVYRGERMLDYQLSWLLDGVYTLVLAREDAWGLVNLTITAKSKSMSPQTTVLDFGIPWLKAANWRRAALLISSQITHDLQDAHTGLTEVYGRLTTDLQVIMGDVVKAYHDLRFRQETQEPSILAQSKQLSEAITHNAIQQVRSAVFVLHKRSVKVNEEARELISYTWHRLSKSAKIDPHSVMDRVHEVKRATLGRAQTRARYIVGRG